MAKSAGKIIDDAYKHFMKGKYEKALELFRQAEKLKKEDLKIQMKVA